MVSALWNASAAGRLEDVQELLIDATTPDIEAKDDTGITPLIMAVQNGHVEVVRALLEKGADPTQGPTIQYATDPVIIEMLKSKLPTDEKSYSTDPKAFYPPSVPYAYYGPPPSSLPEGAVYYSPSTGENGHAGGPGNLPPPDIAKLIPCRYFPACRYGTSCIFAHPQGPYFQGSLPPPAQYPAPYDSVNPQPYQPNYYPVPPPSFPPPNSVHQSPGPAAHSRSASDAISPPSHYNPTSPQPVPYPPVVSPSLYPHSGQVPIPMTIPPLPPIHQPSAAGAQPQPVMYPTPFSPQQAESALGYPSVTHFPHPNGVGPTSPSHPDTLDSSGQRRSHGRRPQAYPRKPPCLFFPAGKCKNGDDCRFPHILPDSKGALPRGKGNGHVNGPEDKLATMSMKDDFRMQNGDSGHRSRYSQGKHNMTNGHPQKKPIATKQRVPNADEFPVLGGTSTPPSNRPAMNGHGGPTVAQVLQASPIFRRPSSKEIHASEDSPIIQSVQETQPPHKLPISFAAAATSSAGPDISKEVSVSA